MELNRRLVLSWLAIAMPIVAVVVVDGVVHQRRQHDLNVAYLSAEVQRIASEQAAILRQVEHALGVVARSVDLGDTEDCQRDLTEAHVVVAPYVTGILAMRADGFVPCAIPTQVVGRRFESDAIGTVTESLRARRVAFGVLAQGHVTGRRIFTVAYPMPERDGVAVGAITSGVLVDKLAELAGSWRGPAAPQLSWVERGGAVYPLGGATAETDANIQDVLRLPSGAVTAAGGNLLAVADVTDHVRLVARVPAAELDADWTRRIITPALLVLALLLAGLALALIALKRWIIEPMRELDRGLIASAARVAVADGLPAEWQSLRGRAAARDEAWAEAVKLRDVLVNEVNHRVANTLQMVVSLLRLHDAALARADPSQAGAILREAQDRVSTIAVVHRQLRAAAAGGVDDVRKLLWSIADTLVAGFGMSDRVSVTVDATPVPLRAEEAVTLGLLLNEWVTNSLKYAYPDGRQGVIRIALHIDGRDMVLDYADGGVGAGEHRREGLGTAITAGLTRQLQGSLEHLSGRGEAYRLRFPMRA